MPVRGKSLLVLLPFAWAALSLTGCVADSPPVMVGATAHQRSATVSWLPPLAVPAPIVGYVVTPYINHVAQSPTRFDATATTRTITGLTIGANLHVRG